MRTSLLRPVGWIGLAGLLAVAVVGVESGQPGQCSTAQAAETVAPAVPLNPAPLFDDFTKGLNPKLWCLAKAQWGGAGVNGGCVPENVHWKNGKVVIEGHGDLYTGPVKGLGRATHGRRVGACLVTRHPYASGRYEVRMKLPKKLGLCTAMWTFQYRNFPKGHKEYIARKGTGKVYRSNHEIDIELPGRPGFPLKDISYQRALCNTWVGLRGNGKDSTTGFTKLPFAVNDGKFHTWRFDWHTGGKNITPRVEFYLDGKLIRKTTTTVPIDAGRFWLGVWFPNKWAGVPKFDTETLEVDWVRITPFHESNDRYIYSDSPAKLPRNLVGHNNWPARLKRTSHK